MKGAKLYVSNDGKHFEEIAGLAIGPSLKPLKKVKTIDAIKKYIDICTSKKCSKNQKVEAHYFQIFADYLLKNDIEYINEVTRFHCESFESQLLKKMKPSSVNRRFNTFKNFFHLMAEWQHIQENPCKNMKKRKEERNPHKVWATEDFKKYLNSTHGVYKKIFQFLWLTGCRPVEVKNLKWTDINNDSGFLTLRCGKNSNVSRQFPINDDISKLLHSMKVESHFVFSEGKRQISNDALYHYCKVRLKALSLNKYTVYGLRHTFGTRLSEAGINAFIIANLMGHSKLETTQRYIKIEKKMLIGALAIREK